MLRYRFPCFCASASSTDVVKLWKASYNSASWPCDKDLLVTDIFITFWSGQKLLN